MTLRCLLALGLLALLACTTFCLLACGLVASPVLPVFVVAFDLLALLVVGACVVLLLFLVDAFAALVVAGGGRRRDAHDQDCGERDRAQDLSGEGKLHVDHLHRRANIGWPGHHFARAG